MLILLSCSYAFIFTTSTHWWNDVVLKTFTKEDWVENFRVSKHTFHYLCAQLSPLIKRRDTGLRKAICVEHRLAITLWCLATCGEYRTIGHLFGVARCTVCVIVHDTCQAIITKLLKKYIQFPVGEQLTQVVDGFKSKWGMIQCGGSIDGCHIPVKPPALNHTDYYNRKGWYSIILQGVVDHEYLFRDVYVGWPGSVHDARVFVNSTAFKLANEGNILNGECVRIGDVDVPIFLVADSAYPLSTWLMKPFPHGSTLTQGQKNFNYHLSRARIVVENAYGRLKARWRRLCKSNDMNIQNIPTVITACCILHNVCEVHGDRFNESWMEEHSDALEQPPSTGTTAVTSDAATAIRNSLVQYYT